jgi:hypothetical protein
LKGTQTVDNVAEQAFPSVLLSLLRRDSPVLFALLYLVLRRLIGWAVGSPAAERSKDIEILVLRHQLEVLHRQMPRPRLRRRDRLLLAAASRVLPRESWHAFLVWAHPRVRGCRVIEYLHPTGRQAAHAREDRLVEGMGERPDW